MALVDKGIVRIRKNADGTFMVTIGGDVVDGELVDIYAEYTDIPRVIVDPRVDLYSQGNDRFSRDPVEVADRENGGVHVHLTPGQVLERGKASNG